MFSLVTWLKKFRYARLLRCSRLGLSLPRLDSVVKETGHEPINFPNKIDEAVTELCARVASFLIQNCKIIDERTQAMTIW